MIPHKKSIQSPGEDTPLVPFTSNSNSIPEGSDEHHSKGNSQDTVSMQSFSKKITNSSRENINKKPNKRDHVKEAKIQQTKNGNQYILKNQAMSTRGRMLDKIKIHEQNYKDDDGIVNVQIN